MGSGCVVLLNFCLVFLNTTFLYVSGEDRLDPGEVVYMWATVKGIIGQSVLLECGHILPDLYIWSYTAPGTGNICAVVYNFGYEPKMQTLAKSLGEVRLSMENASLLIEKTELSAQGLYTCQALYSKIQKFVYYYVQLVVIVPVSKPYILVSDISPIEGTPWWKWCALTNGTGPFNYIWEYENPNGTTVQLHEGNVSQINITSVSRNSTGWYRCLISNEINQQSSDWIWLDIKFGPDIPQISITPYSPIQQGYSIIEGKNVTLMCQTSSNPISQYTWLYNNSQVYTGEIFTITKILRNQTGYYSCLAQNSYLNSSSKTSVRLSIYYAPEGNPICTIFSVNNYTDLAFWCSWEGGYPQPSIHWSRILVPSNRTESILTNGTLIQPGALTANNSTFACHAFHVALSTTYQCYTTTLLPPGEPQCFAYGVNDNEHLALSCSWEGGSPSAVLWWISNGAVEGTREESGNVLVFKDREALNGTTYICNAKHPLTPLNKQCMLQIVAPVLITEQNIVSVVEGNNVQLQCFLKASNPSTDVVWYNNQKKVVSDTQKKYILHKEVNWTSLTVNNANSRDSGQYCCSATNAVGKMEVPITLLVKIPVSKPYILVNDTSPVEGLPMWMSCNLSNGTGPIHYIWEHESHNGTTTQVALGNVSWINMPSVSRKHIGWYRCLASNDVNMQRSDRIQLDIKYGPDIPQVSITPNSLIDQYYSVIEKETVLLSCQATSNPTSKYAWLHNNVQVYTGQLFTINKIQRSQAGNYSCLAENSYLNTTSKTTITITVYYPPNGNPICTIYPVNNYTDLVLWCSLDGGYPQASLYWTQNNVINNRTERFLTNATVTQPGALTADNSTFTCNAFHAALGTSYKCSLTTLLPSGEPKCLAYVSNNETLMLSCSWKGGFPLPLLWWDNNGDAYDTSEENNLLMLKASASYSGTTFTCHAKHPLSPVNKHCVLKLEAPVLVTQQSTASVVEGNDIQLNCFLKVSYPSAEIIWCDKNKNVLPDIPKRYILNKDGGWANLTVHGTTKEDSGQYWCTASNVVGKTEIPITLIVKIPVSKPTVTVSNLPLVEGTPMSLRCIAEKGTNPINYIWEYENQNGMTTLVAEGNRSILSTTSTSRNYTGWYRCLVSNEVNQQRSDRIWLDIKYGPDVPRITILPPLLVDQKYVAFERESVSMMCQAASNPPSQYIWFYNNSQVYTAQQFTIASISRTNTGSYSCVAQNTYLRTNSKNTISVIVHYPPDGNPTCSILPSNNYTDLLLSCSWDGGYPQPSLDWTLLNSMEEHVPNATVIVPGPRTPDNSTFICHASHVASSSSYKCRRTVSLPPGEPQCSAYATRNNEYLMLSCSWEGGYPRALLWWVTNGAIQGPSEENSNIVVLRASATYSGMSFVCNAKHPLIPVNKQCVLKLVAPVLITQRSMISVYEGSDVQLTCILKANYPITDIIWFNNHKKQVWDATKKYLLHREGALSNLTVLETDTVEDNGQYWCSAINAVGGAEIPITLIVKRYPDPPNVTITKIIYTSRQRTEVSLEWKVKGEGNLTGFILEQQRNQASALKINDTITWQQVVKEIMPDVTSYKLSSLDPSVTYVFRILAVNHRTQGYPSEGKTPGNPSFKAYPAVVGAAMGGAILATVATTILVLYILKNRNNIPCLYDMFTGIKHSQSRENIEFPEDETVNSIDSDGDHEERTSSSIEGPPSHSSDEQHD